MSNTKRIPEDIIDEIRHQTDIVAVISEYVTLTQTGKNYKGLCPFHREKTPSFTVSPQKQIFHCYGCGVGGNVFTFLMQHEKYTFPEVVNALAKRLGIRLPTKTTAPSTQHLERSDVLYKLHVEATQYFVRQFTQSEQGKKARKYLQNRGIGDNIVKMFSLGYASPAWDDLQKAFIRKYPVDILLESGLLIKKKNGIGRYDRFRDRLMIPIHDDRGRIVAFGGRILGEGEPKYLNSPESRIFHKGRVLFGLHHAKDVVRRNGHILLVEGYFDMIVPYSFGLENIAATMGTALTEHHLRLLQRYAKKVTLVFDPDPAGIRAVRRTLDLFLESGFEVRAAILPGGEDPDTAVRRMGVEQFQQHINQAPSLLDFIRDRIVEQYDLSKIDQQIACAKQILPTIAKIKDITERSIQINKTAELLKAADFLKVTDKSYLEGSILEEFRKIMITGKHQITKAIPKKQIAIPPSDRYFIKALLKDKGLIQHIKGELNPEDLPHPLTQKVVRELFIYNDKTDFEARILDAFNATEYRDYLTKLFMEIDEVVDPKVTVRDYLYHLRQKDFEHQTLDITRKVKTAQEKNNKEILNAFLEQKNKDLQKKKKNFKKK